LQRRARSGYSALRKFHSQNQSIKRVKTDRSFTEQDSRRLQPAALIDSTVVRDAAK
jgi:hypothetical protein